MKKYDFRYRQYKLIIKIKQYYLSCYEYSKLHNTALYPSITPSKPALKYISDEILWIDIMFLLLN